MTVKLSSYHICFAMLYYLLPLDLTLTWLTIYLFPEVINFAHGKPYNSTLLMGLHEATTTRGDGLIESQSNTLNLPSTSPAALSPSPSMLTLALYS